MRRSQLVAVALALLGQPAEAQEVTLPSGLTARLYDVVLEERAGAPLAPDAFTDPEGAPDAGALGEGPLDVAPDPLGAEAAPAAGGVARFRLVVPELGEAGYDAVAGDFGWLCEALALPALAANGWRPAEVVVALADREVAHGATDAQAVQFFEGFRVADDACVPQAF